MIWQSVPMMTVIDIVIVLVAFGSLRMLYRQRHMLARPRLLLGSPSSKPSAVTSKGLCQGEEVGHSLV